MELNQVLKVIHKTALGFIESEDEDVMTSRDLFVLQIHKAICNNIKAEWEKEKQDENQ